MSASQARAGVGARPRAAVPATARAVLSVDLAALRANWAYLNQVSGRAECAGVIKADAYGLGLAPIAKALTSEGCKTFFVATVDEGRAHEGKPNPMQTVVRFAAKILQIRELEPGATIGYGAIYRVQRAARIATIGCGYADGFLRALSVKTGEAGPVGFIGDYPVPIVGRVSMDFTTVDVTDAPAELARRGAWVEVMGARVTVDDLTDRAGTIGYELLTRLGQRVHRVYEGAGN